MLHTVTINIHIHTLKHPAPSIAAEWFFQYLCEKVSDITQTND